MYNYRLSSFLILPSAALTRMAGASWNRDYRPDVLLSDRTAAMVYALLEPGIFPLRSQICNMQTTILPCRYTGFFIEMALEAV
ncbi:hypothetical protein [Undibacterium sp. SXout20W]|uniref:hypothetical protein n=1 Tax=Undibacterium sp. SXout20W TaxID=3413051 RepID=UPI003BF11423